MGKEYKVRTEIERIIINHCSPVLLGFKPAALFTLPSEDCLACLSGLLPSAITLMILRKNGGRRQALAFDKGLLEKTLLDERVLALLESMGYPPGRRKIPGAAPHPSRGVPEDSPVFPYLAYFKQRFETLRQFPHEIGLFLGYPVEDVLGFVKYRGRNYKLCGVWKVYGNVERARRDFSRYEVCRERMRAWLRKKCPEALEGLSPALLQFQADHRFRLKDRARRGILADHPAVPGDLNVGALIPEEEREELALAYP
jgi:hypothetical protein